MARAWLVGWMVLAACSFDSAGLGRGTGPTSTDTTIGGTDTSTGGPATTSTTTATTTTTPTTDDSATATTVEVTITSGDSSSGGSSSGGDSSTGTGTGTSTGDGTGTSTGTTGVDTSGGSSSGSTTGEASSSGGGSSSSGTTGEAPSCVDGVLNGAESDVDCGGPDCSGCADGGQCDAGSDCLSLSCVLGKCAAATCADGVVNGEESDIDCGGLACPGCGNGEVCDVDDDCFSGICGPKLCVATACENLKQDGQETNIDCGGGCPACVGPVLNEVNYDQAANDAAEFVELFNPGPSPIALTGMQLVLVNGANKTPYTTIELGPAGQLKVGGYLVVRTPGLVVAPGALTVDFALPLGNIQNGAPDGVALVDTLKPALLDALSYEGQILDAKVPPLGTVSLVEGQATPLIDDSAEPGSLCRLPNGGDTNDALTDWMLSATPTPGAANVP